MAAFGKIKTNILKLKTGIVLLVFSFCFLPSYAQPTVVHDYEFTTGVDSSLWYDMSVSTPWITPYYGSYQLPFSFFFFDRDFTAVNLFGDGSLLFSPPVDYSPYSYFPSQVGQIGWDAMGIFGYRNTYTSFSYPSTVPIQTAEFGVEGHRVAVIQICSFLGPGVSNKCQVQLREEDNSVTLVYGEREYVGSTPTSIGLLFDANHIAVVNQGSHTVSAQATAASSSWPGQYRYYRFAPDDSLCPVPREVSAQPVWESDSDILVTWNTCSLVDSFRVEYGPTGFAEGSGTSMLVDEPQALIQDLHTGEETEVRVYSRCLYGESGYDSTTVVTCPAPAGLTVSNVSLTSDDLWLRWDGMPRYHSYRVEYGSPGFAEGSGVTALVDTTYLLLPTLSPGERYEARVYAGCTYGESDYASILFSVPCALPAGNRLHYSSLYSDGVRCCTGFFHTPATVYSPAHIVDSGSGSAASRHTVHTDTSERDPRTGNLLRTVPEGFCSSVRLGNWRGGGEQESIFYTIDVDTNDFDLLILRYALVEQQPNHDPWDQPHFDLDITTPAGVSISPCYHGNFVSGDLSGWNTVPGFYGVLWRDWDAVGVDLSPLHGQTIVVALSNYDCAFEAHYGYAYFTLQTGTKRILAENCGDSVVNTFRAPQGFTYRWYSQADTNATLSTADSLHVTAVGDYGCHVTYQLSNQVCGFTLSTYAGGRYPVAAFAMQPLDSCGSRMRFVNQSVIARDSAHTQLTNFPCDGCLWVIDDSITTTATHPSLSFAEGTHTVTLYAMLAGGVCVDSVRQSFSVTIERDTIRAAVCEGESYRFFGQELAEAGEYRHQTDCRHTVLYLEVNPVYSMPVYDTFVLGTAFRFDDGEYRLPGGYTRHYTTADGCDSVFTIYLSCFDMRDTTVCVSTLPIEWHGVTFSEGGGDTLLLASAGGTDSIVVLNVHVLGLPELSLDPELYCRMPGGYSLSLPDTLCYQLSTLNSQFSILNSQFSFFLSPADTTVYILTADYCDSVPGMAFVSCPWRDTLLLAPVAAVDARLGVSPLQIDEDNPSVTAVDLTSQPHARQWYIDSVPLLSQDSVVTYRATPSCDSVRVMLVVNTDVCADTAYASVPVRIQLLWFPNVFTPDEPTNNLFRGYGTRVKAYELSVYTRWGDCIFRTKDINEGWDGTCHGVRSPASAYPYVCRYTTLEGEPRTVSGTVALVR